MSVCIRTTMSSEQAGSSSANNSNNNNNPNAGFQPVRQNAGDNNFDNSMQMFAMKQQGNVSSVTGTVYSGPPAKYFNNHTGYMRPMVAGQKYVSYNNGLSMQQQQQQRRQNNNNNNNNNATGVDNATNDSINKRKVFVGGLSPDTKTEHLSEYFSKFGVVENTTIKYDKSGRSKGFGFVLFEDAETPTKVYAQDVHIIQGKRVDTKSAHRRDQALARKVFVGGLDPDVTDQEIQDYFSQFGTIAQIEAPIDKLKQKRRPYCFILFDNEQSAEEVLKQSRHTLAGKPIDCKHANPKTLDNNQQNANLMQQPLTHYNMPGLNQNLFPYQPQQRSQQQLQYQQVALAAQQQQQQQQQQHYSYYNQQTNHQQGQTRSQSNRQQLQTNNQPWSPISPAQWQNPNYADPRSYGSYGPSAASASNATWQVNSYGQARSQQGNSTNPANANSTSAQYSYPAWNYNQAQASQGPTSQYNYPTDSASAPPNAFAYQPATGYDHFSSDSAPPPTNYNRQ